VLPLSISNIPFPVNFDTNIVFLLRLGFLKFRSFFKGSLLPNFNNILKRDFLITRVQQLEDIFNIVVANLGA
jgi:hypothetical protein